MSTPEYPIKAKRIKDESFPATVGEYIVVYYEGQANPVIMLPCGDMFMPQNRWKMQNVEDDKTITLEPSILCRHERTHPGVPDWHGYLRGGEFVIA